MRHVWTIARRELRGYFDHPTAYILIVAFLALGLFLAFRSLYISRSATLRPLFDLIPWLMAFFLPAITMRSLAEERRSRTLEWLTAQPLRERDVVLGKFLGNWIFALIAVAGTVPTAIGVLMASEADAGIMMAQYIGTALLAAHGVAIGLWASSVTRNQITAFILAMGVSVTLVLLGVSVVSLGLPAPLSAVATQISVLHHFEGVARGVIDARDVLYFVSVAGLFLLFTGFALARERLSRARGSYRRLRLGTLAAAVAVLVLNLLGGYIHGRLDLTRDRLYTLDRGTRELVRTVPDIVQVKLYVSDQLPVEVLPVLRDVRDLLSDVRRAARGKIRVIEQDPERNQEVAREAEMLGITPTTFNVLRSDEFQVKRGWLGLAILYAGDQRVIPLVDRTDDLEFRLASFIASMTATTKPAIGFVSGRGMRGSFEFQALQDALRERYDLKYFDVDTDSVKLVRDTVRAILLPGPTEALSDSARTRLDRYLKSGGGVLLLVETAQVNPQYPQAMPVSAGLDAFLATHGIRPREGIVFDLRAHANVVVGRQGPFSVVSGYPLWPVVRRAGEHATTRNLENLNLAWATAFDIEDTTHVQPLWTTTEQAGTRAVELPIMPSMLSNDPGAVAGSLVTAVAVDPGAAANGESATGSGRMIVVGDADFLTDRFVRENPQNGIFAANALDWLAQDEMLIRIRSKHRTPPALVFKSGVGAGALKWGNLIGVPIVFAALGAVRVTRRAHRARKHWEDAR